MRSSGPSCVNHIGPEETDMGLEDLAKGGFYPTFKVTAADSDKCHLQGVYDEQ